MALTEQEPPRASGVHVATRAVVAVTVIVLALVVALVFLAVRPDDHAQARPSAAASPGTSASRAPTVADIARRVTPSVAVVQTSKGSLGTGVIAAEDGTIVTANHVVAVGGAITVLFADGTKSAAKLTAADPANDIALLAPATLPQPVVPATLGGGAQRGGAVVAIGNPLGLAFSVSSGVVSGVDRTATTDQGKLAGLIQFDASANPGSSGGPLLDADGNLIGIVVAIADPGRDDAFAGIAFAVPIGAALGAGGRGTGAAGPQK